MFCWDPIEEKISASSPDKISADKSLERAVLQLPSSRVGGKMKRLIILFFLVSISPHNSFAEGWHTTPDKWKEPRIFHSEFDNAYESRIRISHVKIDEKILKENEKERNYSSNHAYWFLVYPPDTVHLNPWSTEIRIFNERDYIIKIELVDYAGQYTTTFNGSTKNCFMSNSGGEGSLEQISYLMLKKKR